MCNEQAASKATNRKHQFGDATGYNNGSLHSGFSYASLTLPIPKTTTTYSTNSQLSATSL